mgnify:CR=1 FL=1
MKLSILKEMAEAYAEAYHIYRWDVYDKEYLLRRNKSMIEEKGLQKTERIIDNYLEIANLCKTIKNNPPKESMFRPYFTLDIEVDLDSKEDTFYSPYIEEE